MIAIVLGVRCVSSPGSQFEHGIAAILWVSVPLEVRIEKAGSRKVYVSARKVRWALDSLRQAEGSHRLSAVASSRMHPLDSAMGLRYTVSVSRRLSNKLDNIMRFDQPLNQIFDHGVKIRVLRFLCRRGGQWSGRRLAAELQINPTTMHKALRELREATVLDFQKMGNTFVYSLADDHYLVQEILRPVFRQEAQGLAQVAKRLRQALGPAFQHSVVTAALYGSVARHQERPTSDLDVLFLVRSPQAKRQVQHALNRRWEAITRRFGNSVAPYVNTVREAQQKARRGVALFQEILKAHQVLWGKPLEEVLHGRQT